MVLVLPCPWQTNAIGPGRFRRACKKNTRLNRRHRSIGNPCLLGDAISRYQLLQDSSSVTSTAPPRFALATERCEIDRPAAHCAGCARRRSKLLFCCPSTRECLNSRDFHKFLFSFLFPRFLFLTPNLPAGPRERPQTTIHSGSMSPDHYAQLGFMKVCHQ